MNWGWGGGGGLKRMRHEWKSKEVGSRKIYIHTKERKKEEKERIKQDGSCLIL